ncbi:hypothetical protein G3480_10710 [Thiorhodococcus mannitoliphagus]|uniref:Uncharacterized protein n=1 Tax=Thiorhodococcus mannitoliphagus TaxID=329406 RepID=A0A6P1DVQ6_9GAMM|nr:hypothetical protein [Thiorhodococcus mannitoliphagus]NEX20776.1 hypothetical protein [Thiorhodococcus mannitoliphagus]
MLTITDLTLRHNLNAASMSSVRGGFALSDFDSLFSTGIVNAPQIDLGTHLLAQEQALAVNQAGNIGGLNLVISDQTQNGVSGQVTI